MKILSILFRVPYPLKDGGAIALYNLAKGMKELGADLTILSYNTSKHFVDPIPPVIAELGQVHTVYLDNHVRPLPAFLNLFTNKSYHVQRFVSANFSEKLKELLQKERFDVIHFDGLFTSMYLDVARKYAPKAVCTLRQHNVEHQIWERVADGTSGPKKWYLNLLASRLKKYEEEVVPKFDAIIPITGIDSKSFEKMGAKKQYVLPLGVDVKQFERSIIPDRNSVFHLGSLDWIPNQEGIKWFAEKVWPLVLKAQPDAQFYIAGRYIPDWIYEYSGRNNIHVVGEVDNAIDFMSGKEIMIVPLKSGSGMRVKIIEGFACKKAVVSTSVGAEGIDYRDEVSIEIADTEQLFAEKIVNLLENHTKRKELGEHAHQLVLKKYSNKAIVTGLLSFYTELINNANNR